MQLRACLHSVHPFALLFDGKTKSQKRSVSSGHAGLPLFGVEGRGA